MLNTIDDSTMLGLRLDPLMSRQLTRFAAATRRSKSDVARDAIREYFARHDSDGDLRTAVRRIAAATGEDDLRLVDADHDDLMGDVPPYGHGREA